MIPLAVGVGIVVAVALIARVLIAVPYRSVSGAPFIGTHTSDIEPLLRWADLSRNDSFLDLGSGDGRVLGCAASSFGVSRAVGVEVETVPYLLSKMKLRALRDRVQLIRGDIRNEPWESASFVFVYLKPKILEEISTHARKHAAEGTRVLSVSFPMPLLEVDGWSLIRKGSVGRYSAFLYKKRPR
jgi:SAM-dependent methyltransferase